METFDYAGGSLTVFWCAAWPGCWACHDYPPDLADQLVDAADLFALFCAEPAGSA